MARLLRTFRDGIGTVLGPSRLFPLVLLLSIVPSLGFGAEIPLDEPGFTKALAKLFRKALPGTKVTIDGPLSLEVRPPDGDTHRSSLHTLYDFCQRNPQNCAAAVQNHVAQMSDTYHRAETAPDRKLLRAVLRPSGYVEEIRKMYAGKEEPPVAPFMGDLWIVCVLDLPQAIRTLGPGDLAKLGLSRADALALATKNDAAILVPIEQAAHPFPGREVSLVATSPYEASRLLAPQSWAAIAAKNGGQLLVAAPGTDVMIYMDARRPNAVDTMRRAVGVVAMKATRPLSSQIFKWSPAGWALVQQ